MALSADAVVAALKAVEPSADADYTVVAMPDGVSSRVHVAVSRQGTTALLVPIASVAGESTRLTHGLALRGTQVLEFARGSERWREPAAIVECRDAKLLRTFAAMAAALVGRLGPDERPSWDRVASLFGEWEQLLGRRQILGGDAELGLWGELWMLAHTERPSLLLEAWRGPEAESVDFLLDGIGIEVKAGRRAGVHMISQTQVEQPVGELPVILSSLHVMADPLRGRSLAELVNHLAGVVADTATFEEKLAAVGYSRDDEAAYTRRYALVEPPSFYDAAHIPRVQAADPGVSQLRYRVELRPDAALEGSALEKVVAVLGLAPATYEYPCA